MSALKAQAVEMIGRISEADMPSVVSMLRPYVVDDAEPTYFSIDEVPYEKLAPDIREALEDVRLNRNLYGPFKSAKEAVEYALASSDDDIDEEHIWKP